MTEPKLKSLLEMLINLNIDEFEGLGIRVKFKEMAPYESKFEGRDVDPERARRKESQKSQWHHPALWGPNGSPPAFPVEEKK